MTDCPHATRTPYATLFQARASAAYSNVDVYKTRYHVTRHQCEDCGCILEKSTLGIKRQTATP